MVKSKATKSNQGNNNSNSAKMGEEKTKPKFDKKKWRERKYSNKFKVEQWEKRREKAVLKQYYKDLKNDPLYAHKFQPKNTSKESNENEAETNTESPTGFQMQRHNKPKKLNSYEAARAEMKRIQEERNRLREERERKKKEMEEQLEEYKKKRAEKYKILSKKNRKGQPVMKGRLQMLYDEIKQSVNSGS